MSEPSPVRTFAGAGLMAVGGLMAALCGTCSAVGLISALGVLASDNGIADGLGILLLVAIIGGIPTLLGLWMVRRGWRAFQPPEEVLQPINASVSDDRHRGDAP